jgi:putative peptide maturation dehydrogenase
MKVHRPALVFVERRAPTSPSLRTLLSAQGERHQWIALAPHLGEEVELQPGDLPVFEALDDANGVEREALVNRFGESRVERLVSSGLLLGDHAAHAGLRARDQALRDIDWWPPAALAQSFGRWSGVDVAAHAENTPRESLAGMVARDGPPPPAVVHRRPDAEPVGLPPPAHGALDDLFGARTTCRNFDPLAALPLQDLATTLHRVFGAQAGRELAPGAVMLKKNSPSGGGLHPVDAYVLAQRVDGLAPGLYHHDCVAHALEPMQGMPGAQLASLAHDLVAGQAWFANAPVLVLMAARFQRNFWKYRRHAKAWKVVLLDAGHLSQNFYLSATELGYGAFVTGAINDACAERLFDIDGLGTGAIAVCGMGRRAARSDNAEFDTLDRARPG